MTPKELKALAQTMRELGITHLKTADVELNLAHVEVKPELDKPKSKRGRPKKLPTEQDEKIQHTIESVKATLALGDEEIMDRMFPIQSEDMT
jgi:hypothetical protein